MSAVKTRIMYIQEGTGPGRIGRVRFSKSGRTVYYGELELLPSANGPHVNFVAAGQGDSYWVSGPRKDGQDTLYPGVVEIDADVVEEYWRDVRGEPGKRDATYRSTGVHGNHATR